MLGPFAVAGPKAAADEGVVNLVQRSAELVAVAATPFLPADEPHEFALAEGDIGLHWPAIAGMLLEQRDEDLVGELAGLSKLRIGSDDNALFGDVCVDLDLTGVGRCPLRVMAEEGAGDPQKRVLQIELGNRRRRLLFAPLSCL